jgi:amino acid transporter
LVVLVVFGAFTMQSANIVIAEVPRLSSIGAGTLLLVFAFGGAEIALNAGGEIRNPSRTVPLALLFGIGIVFVLYMAIQGVAQGVLGPELAVNLEAPLVATAERAFGPWGRTLLLIGAGISILGVTSGHVLNHPRAVFAAARDGLLPGWLARVHPRFKTPHNAIMFCATLACAIALTGAFKTLAVVSSGSLLLLYLGCSLAVLKLRRKDRTVVGDVFVIPGGPIVPVASSLVIVWLLSNLTGAEAMGLASLVVVASAGYLGVLARRRSGS